MRVRACACVCVCNNFWCDFILLVKTIDTIVGLHLYWVVVITMVFNPQSGKLNNLSFHSLPRRTTSRG